jgi:hypothetical protein
VQFDFAFTALTNELRFCTDITAASQYVYFDDVELFVVDSIPGDRVVYVEADSSFEPDGIPTLALLDDVRIALTDPSGLPSRQILGLTDQKLFVERIMRTEFDVTIVGLDVEPSKEADCKAALLSDVNDFLKSVMPFVTGDDSETERNDVITSVALSETVQAVLAAFAASASSVTFELSSGGGALTSYRVAENELAKLSMLRYV